MATDQEAAWRQALSNRGRDWVEAELQRRPGQPQDVVLDVVFQTPFPTREFCQRWCGEQDNRMPSMSGTGIVMVVLTLVLTVSVAKAVVAFNNYVPNTMQYGNFDSAPTGGYPAEETQILRPVSLAPTYMQPTTCIYMTPDMPTCKQTPFTYSVNTQ